MQIQPVAVSQTACEFNATVEEAVNRMVRSYDRIAGPLGLGVRCSNYDDLTFSFAGGVGDRLRKIHYDKSLRLLWKAEQHVPFTSFKDCTADERLLMQLAEGAMDDGLKQQIKRVQSDAYKELLNQHYTQEQKQAIVNILATIAHGEAYAWLVSADLLAHVKSTGGRGAMTMQVLEEAKHFLVLREVLEAFECDVPRMNAWEYITLENILKQDGLEKFFGMNVIVEGLALGIFGTMAAFPGLEVLQMFHLDESRHTALPHNYFRDFPMTTWEKYNPLATTRRLLLLLPAIPFLFRMERDFAALGVDVFDFSGSVLRKVLHLSARVGFHLPMSEARVLEGLNGLFNLYCSTTRENHQFKDFIAAEATLGEAELEVERGIFQEQPDATEQDGAVSASAAVGIRPGRSPSRTRRNAGVQPVAHRRPWRRR